MVTNAIRKPVPNKHHRLGIRGYLKDQNFFSVNEDPLHHAADRRAQPSFRHRKQFIKNLPRISVSGRSAIVINTQQERAAISVGKRGNAFSHKVACFTPLQESWWIAGMIPKRFKFQELALFVIQKRSQLAFGKKGSHRRLQDFIPSGRSILSTVTPGTDVPIYQM